MLMDVMVSSKTCIWETPQNLFDELNDEFHFTLDVCAFPENAKVSNYFTPEINGLSQEWKGVCWMNPPYGREISSWIKKAVESASNGAMIVCLLPARTDTRWWHDYVIPFGEIRFLKGRLKFGGSKHNAPFPSAVVIFKGKEFVKC
jgi:phage N-6-adenine-methyltransferase